MALYWNLANLKKYTGNLSFSTQRKLLTNCNVLTRAEAKICGVETKAENVVIYPEWIKNRTTTVVQNDWEIIQVLFKGCYEDLLLQKEGITVRVLNDHFGKYTEGMKISLKFNNWLEYFLIQYACKNHPLNHSSNQIL